MLAPDSTTHKVVLLSLSVLKRQGKETKAESQVRWLCVGRAIKNLNENEIKIFPPQVNGHCDHAITSRDRVIIIISIPQGPWHGEVRFAAGSNLRPYRSHFSSLGPGTVPTCARTVKTMVKRPDVSHAYWSKLRDCDP